MSKLIDWLAGISAFFSVWVALLYHFIEFEVLKEYRHVVTFFPVIVILCFGVYAASVVLWRVYNFRDCIQEAQELQKEISQARTDLTSKGIIFY